MKYKAGQESLKESQLQSLVDLFVTFCTRHDVIKGVNPEMRHQVFGVLEELVTNINRCLNTPVGEESPKMSYLETIGLLREVNAMAGAGEYEEAKNLYKESFFLLNEYAINNFGNFTHAKSIHFIVSQEISDDLREQIIKVKKELVG